MLDKPRLDRKYALMRARQRVMVVFGTRPEAIKMAPVIHALRQQDKCFETLSCATAQHRELLDQVLPLFGIVPDFDLDCMRAEQPLGSLTGALLAAMGPVLAKTKPDIVLVQGDTATTFAAALACFYAGIRVAHVEAGLRSGDNANPFPEEFHRRACALLAAVHFAPTENARAHLLREGCAPDRVVVTGNTGIDALHLVMRRLRSDATLRTAAHAEIDEALGFHWREEPYVLVTAHRRENLGQGIANLCTALRERAAAHPERRFVFVHHANPAARDAACGLLSDCANVHLLGPVDYPAFTSLLAHCDFVVTDSGGIQEEAPGLGKPVLVVRETTERPEGVEAGTAQLVGRSRDDIACGIEALITDRALHRRMGRAHNPYGDGRAAQRIADFLARSQG